MNPRRRNTEFIALHCNIRMRPKRNYSTAALDIHKLIVDTCQDVSGNTLNRAAKDAHNRDKNAKMDSEQDTERQN